VVLGYAGGASPASSIHRKALKLIGAELDNDEILVFQEAKAPLPSALSMRHDALREIIPEQVNTVNILLGSQTRTLVFAKKDTWKDL
jgi:hypothetical protein